MNKEIELLKASLNALENTYDYCDYPGGMNCSQSETILAIREYLSSTDKNDIEALRSMINIDHYDEANEILERLSKK